MDGNGRWAQRRGRSRVWGHRNGVASVRRVIEAAVENEIPYLTLYAFSDENWGRPWREVSTILALLRRYILSERDELLANGVRLEIIGELDRLPESARRLVVETCEMLAGGDRLVLTIALSYGGRNEIVQACRQIAEKVVQGRLQAAEITADTIRESLWTGTTPDPDLLIRTSGERRISNFLLWQSAYTEFWFTETLWPDFQKQHFVQALEDYSRRKRRFGLAEVPTPVASALSQKPFLR